MTEKELAAFYPYKVFCSFKTVVEEKKFLFGKTFERVLMPLDLHYLFGSPKRYEYIKPILFPLSMLTQEITHPIEGVIIPLDFISTSNSCSKKILKMIAKKLPLDNLAYWQIERLLELKFDVFGNIEKGDAIAVTNEFNPYK